MSTIDTPQLLVIRRGSIGPTASGLLRNLRLLFSPNCAAKLKEGGKQSIKDFLSVKNVLNLSHLIMISQSKKLISNKSASTTLKIAKLANGPTITFTIERATLMSDITLEVEQSIPALKLLIPPFLILHGFKDELGKSMASLFQSMFPKLEKDNFRRIVLCKMDQNYIVELRQYVSQKVDLNISKNVRGLSTSSGLKKIVSQGIPIVKLFDQTHDDDDEKDILMYKDHIPGFDDSTQGLRLIEIGPRITLKLIKIESEVCAGAVKYHRYVNKTEEEIEKLNVNEPKLIKKRKREMALLERVFKQVKKKE